jgi:hypothetical protein
MGSVLDTVSVPAGGTLVYSVSGTVLKSPEMPLIYPVYTSTSTSAQIDINTSNNTATDTDEVGIFANGFDTSTEGSQVVNVNSRTDAEKVLVIPVSATVDANAPTSSPVQTAIVRDQSGTSVALHVRRSVSQDQVRLSTQQGNAPWDVGRWTDVDANATLFMGWQTDDTSKDVQVLRSVELQDDSKSIITKTISH